MPSKARPGPPAWACEAACLDPLGDGDASLRLFDSFADTVFYVGVAGALWLREAQVLRGNRHLLAVLGTLEIARYAVDLRKFGKGASYHSYLAKTWGLSWLPASLRC